MSELTTHVYQKREQSTKYDLIDPFRTKAYFENLDALRFISFFVVFLSHVGFYEWVTGFTSNKIVLTLAHLATAGRWGVTFFFALSGFLITWLMLVEKEKHGNVNIRAFYMRRVLRIWPLYYLVFFIGIAILPALYRFTGQKFFFDYNPYLYGTFLSNYGDLSLDKAYNSIRSYPLVMNISWSVSIEEQFYLVWPLLYALHRRFIGYISPFFILLSCIAAIFLRGSSEQISLNTLTCIGELAMGGLLAYLIYYKEWAATAIQKLHKGTIALVYLGAAASVSSQYLFQVSPLQEHFLHLSGALFFGLIIVEQNFSTESFFKFGKLKLFGNLGRISYGLYMLHPLAIFVTAFILQKLLHKTAVTTGTLAFAIFAFLITVLMAELSYRLMERPLLKLKKRFENKN